MKKILISLLLAIMTASLSACSAPAPSSPEPRDTSTVDSTAETSSNALSEDASASSAADAAPLDERLQVADAAMFRGVVEDFAADDAGKTVLVMRGAEGMGFAPVLKAALTEDTRYSFDETKIGNGAFLEIYYGVDMNEAETPEIVDAVAVNDLGSEDMVNYNGTLVEITKDGGSGQLLLDPLDENGMQYAFNYGPETQFYLDMESLKAGDRLNIFHSPIATMSLPPQSPAWEVRLYEAPEEEAPAAAIEPGAPN